MSSEPNGSFNFTADMLASEACSVGDLLVKDEALGKWRVATSANRTSAAARTTAVARTAYGGSIVGKVMYQMSGRVPPEMTGLGAGTATWVRASAAGRFERCTPAGADDVVGKCFADGSVEFNPGVWDSSNYAGGGGGGATPGGSNGQVQINDAGAFGGRTLVGAGGISTSIDATNITIDGSELAPDDASFLTLGTTAGLDNERVLTAGSNVSFVDGGPGGTLTINASGGSGFTAGGDLSGSSSSQTVEKVKGTTITTAGGALPVGAVLRTTAVGTADWGAVDLADTDAVTGVLPSANVASHSGDVTGAHSATVVARANGATIPAAGSLTTGNVLRVSGTSALTYAAVNLAGGANHVTGNLPITNIAPGSNGQFHITTGGASAWGNTATFIGLGTSPAAAGEIRLPVSGLMASRNNGNTADIVWAQISTAGILTMGCDSAITTGTMVSSFRPAATSSIDPIINGSFVGSWTSTTLEVRTALAVAGKVSGFAALSSMFQLKSATINTSGGGTFTATAAQYECPVINLSGHGGLAMSLVLPANADSVVLIRNLGSSGGCVVVPGSFTVNGGSANLMRYSSSASAWQPATAFQSGQS